MKDVLYINITASIQVSIIVLDTYLKSKMKLNKIETMEASLRKKKRKS